MTLEDFINEKLCPTGTVTVWDETLIRPALRLDDMDKLSASIAPCAGRPECRSPPTSFRRMPNERIPEYESSNLK